MKYRPGIIVQFSTGTSLGMMQIEGEHANVPFSVEAQRAFRAGFAEPEFTQTNPETPTEGQHVLVDLSVRLQNYKTGLFRGVRREIRVEAYGSRESYETAVRVISGRPVYEVVEFVLYQGAPTSGPGQRRVVARGTAVELQKKYPRSASTDPLSAEITLMGYTHRRRFYRKNESGKSVQCEDPRPLPHGGKHESFQPTNECGVILASALDLAYLVSHKHRAAHKVYT